MFWIAHSLIVIALVMVVWIIVLNRYRGNTGAQYATFWLSLVSACFLYFISGLTLMANSSKVAEMNAFCNQTRTAYQAHIEEQENTITIGSLPGVILEAPFLQAVSEYNSDLASLRYYNSIPLIGQVVPDSINQLKYISTRFGE